MKLSVCALCALCIYGLPLAAQTSPQADPVALESGASLAETAPRLPPERRVAVFPFLGDAEGITGVPGISTRLREVLGRETGIAQYEPLTVKLPPGQTPPRVDMLPPRDLCGGAKYALCGEFLAGGKEYHIQLWLWDMELGTLVYTDEFACEESGEAVELLAVMTGWLFSQIEAGEVPVAENFPLPTESGPTASRPAAPAKNTAPAARPAAVSPSGIPDESEDWKNNQLYVGLRGGGSLRSYENEAYDVYQKSNSPRLVPEGALHVGLRLSPAFVLQGEIIFSRDTVSFSQRKDSSSHKFTALPIALPLLIKYTFMPGQFLISPYIGMYYIVARYSVFPPLGYTAGFNLGFKMGPGVLFSDLRYSVDMSSTRTSGTARYTREMFSFSVGYELGFF